MSSILRVGGWSTVDALEMLTGCILEQIMDGSPSRGETIPIRLFLGGFDLTPTFRDVNKKFSTRYYLSLVLIDEGKSPIISSSPQSRYLPARPARRPEVFQTIRDNTLPPGPRAGQQWQR